MGLNYQFFTENFVFLFCKSNMLHMNSGNDRNLFIRTAKIPTFCHKKIFGILLVTCFIAAVWHSLNFILMSNRGLDLTDEGLYLLAARPPSLDASWGFPFGWHTAPLFELSQFSIAKFRTLGGVLLFIVSFILILKVLDYFDHKQASFFFTKYSAFKFIFSTVFALSSLFYYEGFLRTPSYNWINLVGIIIASIAFVTHLHNIQSFYSLKSTPGLSYFLPVASFSFGLFYTIPAKPSSAPLVFALTLVILLMTYGLRLAIRWGLATLFFIITFIALALLLNIWPKNFVYVFHRAIEMPKPSPEHTILGAITDVILMPKALFEGISIANPVTLRFWSFGFLLIILAILLTRLSSLFYILGLAFVAIGAFFYSHYVTSTYVLLIILFVIYFLSMINKKKANLSGTLPFKKNLLPIFFFLLPFVYGFGSDSGVYYSAKQASIFFFIAAISLILSFNLKSTIKGLSLIILAVYLLITVYFFIQTNYKNPYRIAPLREANVPYLMNDTNEVIYLDGDLHQIFYFLTLQAKQAGWRSGTPLIGLAYRWNSTLPYVLGAQVPKTLMVTLFGYGSQSDKIAERNFREMQDFNYGDAWVITTTDDAYLVGLTEVLEFHSKRKFPEEYSCVSDIVGLKLWKPIIKQHQSISNSKVPVCQNINSFDSNYNLHRGWAP